ncbi:limbic system-associated membrane protein-like isoform X2 [Mytilus californianus]|uniref:limbic system-associated membrane protein-like isoform X2 n=1 Tax=Mytilus californianus TaxID=6549 RepID=UPI002247CEB5|nr:limbic system-associated membrane protein-like isoform X2 [Mytilus californianus]
MENLKRTFLFPVFICYILMCCLPDVFAVDPSFDVPVFNVTVIAGKTAILPCTVENLAGHKVVWTDRFSTLLTYDIGRIIDDDRIGIERPFTNDWNLLIHDVKYSDAGKYVCQINTTPVKTKTVMLHVLVPPKINVNLSSGDIIAREGDTVTLTCNVSGIPAPTVHWYRRPLDHGISKAKEKLEPTKLTYNNYWPSCTYTFHKTGVGMNGEYLIIHNISRYCDGIYECVAFNDVPPAVNKDIKVEVEFPPEIELQNRRIGQSPGRETILECQITAFPNNYNVWRFKGQDLKTTKKHRIEIYNDGNHRMTLSLRVMDITFADYGNYTCVAQNKLGTDEEVMLLYDHRIHHIPTTTTTRKPLMITTLPKTIWLPEPQDKHVDTHIDGNNPQTEPQQNGGITCTGNLVVICNGIGKMPQKGNTASCRNNISLIFVLFKLLLVFIVS